MRRNLLINDSWLFKEGDIPESTITGKFDTYMISKAQCAKGAANPLFVDDDFEEVKVPHDFVLKGEPVSDTNESQGSFKRGNAWYRRHFVMPCSHENKRVILYFEGAGQHAEVWVNGQFATSNDSMYNSFYADITPYLWTDDSINTIAVRIETRKIELWSYEGGGIYRNVHLIVSDEISVDHWGVWVNPQKNDDNTWNVPVETTIFSMCDDDEDITLVQTIIDQNGKEVATVSNDFTVCANDNILNQNMTIFNPNLWNVNASYLYNLKTQVVRNGEVKDEVITEFGFRTIDYNIEDGLLINGNKVKLRGGCLHHDHGNLGAAVPDSIAEFRLNKMQECGMNSARLAHNNHSSAVTKAADKLGMLILDENRWFNYSDRTQKELISMIKRDRNHPSVFMWSVGNEEPLQSTPIGWKLVKSMRRLIRKYDKTRPVTLALNGGFYDSFAARASDVVGINYNIQNYPKHLEAHPGKCAIASESVASNNTRANYFLDTSVEPSKTYSTAYDLKRASFGSRFCDAVKASEENPFVLGTMIWSGIEYRGEASWPRLYSGSAPIDNCCFEKDSFYQLCSYWKDEPILHVMPHWTFPDRVGETIQVVVYTNQEEVELFLNGKSLGRKTCVPYDAPSWDVVYENGELTAVAYVNGEKTLTTTHRTTGKATTLHLTDATVNATNNGEDTVIVNVHLTDENGDYMPTAHERIYFSCDENAEIIAASSSDPMDHEDPRRHDKKMFNGRAQVIVKVKEGAKSVKIKADARDISLCEEIEVAVKDVAKLDRLPACKNKLSMTTVRRFDKTVAEIGAIDDNYNFADMNSNEPITLPLESKLDSKDYTVITATSLIPLSKNKLALKFSELKGCGKIKVFHQRNCWPNPTPDEFIDRYEEYDFADAKDLIVSLDGFSTNEKMAIVLLFDNTKEFSIDDICYVQA